LALFSGIMPRTACIVVPDVPHHITPRGNNRQDFFLVDDDRRVYFSILKEQSERFGMEILGGCLMTNHIQMIGRPLAEDAFLSKLENLLNKRFRPLPIGRLKANQKDKHDDQNRRLSL
jgi:REP element-mobilizing transposase RayT